MAQLPAWITTPRIAGLGAGAARRSGHVLQVGGLVEAHRLRRLRCSQFCHAFAVLAFRHIRGEKSGLHERRAIVERMKLEAMVNAPTPRRRRNRAASSTSANVYGLRNPHAPAYPIDAPAQTAPVAPARVADDERPRPFDSGRYVW
jgi:hypothetical protein